MQNKSPIKRHPAIVEFSREHHFGLLLVWKIREGLRRSVEPERIGRYVVYFFRIDLEPHFQAEEALLFRWLDTANPLRAQADQEHGNIRSLVASLQEQPADGPLLAQFAQALESHIRFEERTLFNYLQENLSADVLVEIAAEHPATDHAACEIWADRFWEVQEKN